MLRHVLVPLDGSLLSEQALSYVKEIVMKGGKVTLLTVIEVPVDYDYALVEMPLTVIRGHTFDKEQFEKTRHQVRDYLDAHVRDLLAQDFEVECIAESGDPATVIVDVARRHHPQAIVMTTHGRTGISRWLFGSVTQKVISEMPCPVLVVPGKVREEEKKTQTATQTVAPA